MGKPTGFLEFERQEETYETVETRRAHYREFVRALSDEAAVTQGARCMDCGIPFCNNACPLGNLIPDWNDLVYKSDWQRALETLHATNNFPEFTGRICPAPCESACTLGINAAPVGIRSIERAVIDKGWDAGWITPQIAAMRSGKKVAIVGSGPAGLAAAQQLARAGHTVTVFEKSSRIGGLLGFGIPDFKLDKSVIDRRVAQMQAEGVTFKTRVLVGNKSLPAAINNDADANEIMPAAALRAAFDAVILAAGSETPRDLPVPGRELRGVHAALEFLIPQNKEVQQGAANPIHVKGKHVVVIGGGDTGSDCVGTSYRQGAASVTQFELMPMPPKDENKALTWPYWPLKLRTSSSHKEGDTRREFSVATKAFVGDAQGRVKAIQAMRVRWENGQMHEIPGSKFELPCDAAFLALGFLHPNTGLLEAFGVGKDARGNILAHTEGEASYQTSVAGVFAAGDARRGQSLVVWAIREGRQCARAVDEFLMGRSLLPR
ncbi:MAG: glutamate synthase subunit beta [Zoogloeaceae bacterium]|jgi:glutamate synthase (NADPH/NADH) small chain|nr:glutamate synthase subunit beta [Zoogloeaceae bacterium]